MLFLAPLVFMVSGSLRKAGLPPPRTPELIPSPLAWGNYERAFELVDLPRYALNSLLVCAIAVPLTVLFASWTGFAMARLPAPLGDRARRAVADRADGARDRAARAALRALPLRSA